ncbi:glycosyltransferase family 4 protein [Kozakia baliensis]|uniref:glycosyltransferase family 4 protein n=1 Tax=Kozakia baliensis TaxID=153496 RepID=UPI00345BB8C2
MKILHVVRQFSPSVGGLEDSVLSLAAIQREKLGVDAQVVTLNSVFSREGVLPEREVVRGIPVRRLPWRGSTRYPIAPSVLSAVGKFDLVHVHAIDFFFDFLAWTRFLGLHNRPMIASTHGGFFHSGAYQRAKEIWFNTITRMSVRAYAKIVACSWNDADLFKKISGDRLMVIENGITQDKFRNAASPVPTRRITTFGRFARHKRIDLLFVLLSELRKLDPSWSLIVAGRPADQSLETLQTAASKAGVSEAVQFVVDPEDTELRELLGQASYFGCLSEHEGFGLAAVEALSAGLIPVLSTIAPFRRLEKQTGVGLLAEAGRLSEVASSLEALHSKNDPLLRERAMQGAAPYDWLDVTRHYVEVYRDVLSHHAN